MRAHWHGLSAAAVVGLLLSFAPSAGAVTFLTPAGSPGGVDASATFTLGTDSLTLVLTDLLQNPTSAGQTISGISFAIDTPGVPTITSSSGELTTINSDGTYTAPSGSSTLDHWTAVYAPDGVTTLTGAKPNQLIIGPDSAGGFAGLGTYSNANSSITKNFSPWVLGSGTFDLSLPGVLPTSTILGVTFQFGTSTTENQVAGTCVVGCSPGNLNPAPLPPALPLFLTGVGALGLLGWGMRRKSTTGLV